MILMKIIDFNNFGIILIQLAEQKDLSAFSRKSGKKIRKRYCSINYSQKGLY
jgi:hypothetical protein